MTITSREHVGKKLSSAFHLTYKLLKDKSNYQKIISNIY